MIDREEIKNIQNILDLTNNNASADIMYNILTALKEDDSIGFIDAVYSKQNNVDIDLLKNVYKVIKEYPALKENLLDSFSENQMASKTALLEAVNKHTDIDKESTIVIWGSWYGSILIPALANQVKKILCMDLDNEPLQIAKNRLFSNYKNIEYICDDVFESYKKAYINTNLIINTSCEHMPPMKEWHWFGAGALEQDVDTTVFRTPKLSNDCYFAFQSNNMFGIEGHINCVNSIDEFKEQLPERAEVLYQEEVEDTRGTRYMLVGKFMPL